MAHNLVTENYLRLNFTPKSGITPGTDDHEILNCNEILARYNVTISPSTGNYCPKQSELTAIASGLSYISSSSISTSSTIVSVDISDNGQYIFLIVVNGVNNVEIRRYALGTAYNISTISSTYQSLSLNQLVQWNGDTKGCRSLHVTGSSIYFMYSSSIYNLQLNTANDLSSWYGLAVTDVSNSGTNYVIHDVYYVGSYYVTSGDGQTYSNQVRSYSSSYPYATSNSLIQSRGSDYTRGCGLEFNSSGSKYYVMGNYNAATLIEFPCGANSYLPYGSYIVHTNTWDLSANVAGSPNDFCFSDSISNMYVLAGNTIYQFNLPSLG
ncbi:MAG TPA: hypothetical protein VFG54_12140 [Prolixibacteraceae bacterium]|nr:hypothetical protein [Prolixibacteraceae bacterium]